MNMFYLNTFLIFAIFGWSYESICHFLEHKTCKNLLLGPWMPIYGFGILIMELIDKSLHKLKITGKKKIIFCYIISVITLTLLELLGGLLVQYFFHTSFWNYEAIPLSIGPYINIFISLLWGLFGLLIEYIVFPLLTPWIKKIPKWVSILIFVCFLIDNIWCFLNKSFTFMRLIS